MENPLLTLEDWNRALSSMTTWEEVVDLWAKNRHNGFVRMTLFPSGTPVTMGPATPVGKGITSIGDLVREYVVRLGGGEEPGRLMATAAAAWDEETGYWDDPEAILAPPSPQVLELLKKYYPVQYNYWMRRIK
jgi:hypothetical protein